LSQLRSSGRSVAAKQKRFFSFINTDVPNYWTGTKWDYNGITREPNVGKIACGYFVTNVLHDFGFKIDPVFLAQQASSVMIKQLCEPSSIKYFATVKMVKEYVLSRSESEIFIAGLDFHTGFVIRDKEKCYFLHSIDIDDVGVIKEELEGSKGFGSKLYMIGSLTAKRVNFE
jgi:hypothetical protein